MNTLPNTTLVSAADPLHVWATSRLVRSHDDVRNARWRTNLAPAGSDVASLRRSSGAAARRGGADAQLMPEDQQLEPEAGVRASAINEGIEEQAEDGVDERADPRESNQG